jgi:hypothetical protein
VPPLLIPIQHSLQIPSQSNEAGKKIKGIQTGKVVIKLYLFADEKHHPKTPRHHKLL